MAKINFLQRLIRSLAPSVFRPVPTGVLYVMLQSISREISGICPWDTGESCWRNYTSNWSLNCRNILCPGYRNPIGLIAYTSGSSATSSIDNRFDYSSFRYLSVASGGDWLPAGTLGAEILFDFGNVSDPGGFGAGFFGARYWGDNSYTSPGTDIHIGDKWYVDCHADTGVVDVPYPDASNEGSYNAVSSQGTYIGDHDTTYTIELIDFWGYVQNYENALLQINLSTCTDEWLDFWGDYFGLDRLLLIGGYEADSAYRERILKEITRAKGTKAVLLDEAKSYFGSDLVTITEYYAGGAQSVVEVDGIYYKCILNHTAVTATNRPGTGTNWTTFWVVGGTGGNTWVDGIAYIIGDPTSIRWDGPVDNTRVPPADPADPAYGLWPWQFYINLPTQRAPSSKFIKSGSSFEEAGQIWTYEGGTGYYYPFGTFIKLNDVDPTGGLGGDLCFSIPVNPGDALCFGCQYKFSGVRLTFITPGVAGTYIWEYWNSAGWTQFVPGTTITDTTNSLSLNGGAHWLVPETGWSVADAIAYNIPNTGSDLYWVRCRVVTIPTTCPRADQGAILHAGSTNRGVYIGTQDIATSGAFGWRDGAPTAVYLHQPATAPLVSVYDTPPGPSTVTGRDKNNIYIYRESSFAKPVWETGLQDIIDRLKTAGTAAIINPMD